MGGILSRKKKKPSRTIHVSPKKQPKSQTPPKEQAEITSTSNNACNVAFCKMPMEQSPIAIPSIQSIPNASKVSITFGSTEAEAYYQDFNIFFTWTGGARASLILNGIKYTPLQFHFHTPSEHTIEGTQYPFEMHIVYTSETKDIAIVAFVFKYGDIEDNFLQQIWPVIPKLKPHKPREPVGIVDGNSLLSGREDFYRYSGAEKGGVEWVLVRQPRIVSPRQVAVLFDALHTANARPLQPLTGRDVTLYVT
ncbi:carbonic anhydrase precursor [Thraustotheca clavata]|uniref:Carbonic anhydrase n=1 Tax=Thraustotheca clavata TaxID=74557 RepID=A0A1W0A847_9STRA|nr:carbonic anhydrase precursor [Thraustotheca clavata]